MKILQLGKFFPILGGVEKVMYDLLTGFAAKGIECDMLCANHDTSARDVIEQEFTSQNKIVICPTWFKLFATMISPSLVPYLRRNCNKYDIIHIHHPDPMVALALFFSGYKGKVVLHWHSDILKQSKLLKLYMPLQNWLVKRSDVIVGTTPVYVKESPHLINVQGKCTYLPIGISPIVWDKESVTKIKNQYKGKKIVFSLGRLVSYKGYDVLIDAARQLPDDVVVLIGGSGPLNEKLQKQIDDNNLTEKVYLLGRVSDEDLPNYFRAADIYCLSSTMKTEAFAIVQVEAMACGVPVVSTRIPGSGVAWVNMDGVSGLTVEACNVERMSEALNKLLSDADLYKKLSSGAFERYERLFRKEDMLTNCLKIYESLNS